MFSHSAAAPSFILFSRLDKLTVPQRKNHRIGVFVDVANMYHSAKNLYGARVNFGELLKIATAGRELVRALAYVVRSDTEEERAFFDALEKFGFELKSKDLQVFAGGTKKGDWDVGLTVDAIRLARQLDAVVIVSGDGDYEPLVEYLKSAGVIVEVVAFRRSTSSRLVEAADNFIDIDERKKTIMRIHRSAKSNRPERGSSNGNGGTFMPPREESTE